MLGAYKPLFGVCICLYTLAKWVHIVCTSVQLLVGTKDIRSFKYLCLQYICEVYLQQKSNQTRVSVGCLYNFANKVSMSLCVYVCDVCNISI